MREDVTSGRIRFDAVEIDLDGHCLRVDGREVPVEPKAYAVLVLLARQPGHAFTRDDILDAVWGHTHVTPGVLNRIVTLLRQALGESAGTHRYLHTVHGVGYRFDLPAVPDAADTASMPLPIAEPVLVATPPAPASGRDSPRTPRRLAFWLLPLLAALAVAGWALHLRNQRASPAMPTHAVPPTLVVMPLKPIGEGAGVRTLAEGLSEELIDSLAQIQGLRVIARESTLLATAQTRDPAQLVQRLGITHALAGSLQQNGQALRIRLRLVDARSGDTLWAKEFTHDAADVQQLQREIAESVATSLTLKFGLHTAPAKSGDAEFLRRFLVAQALLPHDTRATNEGRVESAESEFRALLRERPDDARVHAALATALDEHVRMRPTLPASVHAEALLEAGIAQRQDPTLPQPYFIQATDACQHNAWEACLSLLQQASARGMPSQDVDVYHAIVLVRLGYLAQAEALARTAVASDPLNGWPHFFLARILDTEGRHEEAREYLTHAGIGANYGRWFNAVWRHDYPAAERILADGLVPGDVYADKFLPGYQAAMAALEDPSRWPEAEAVLRRSERDTGLFNFVLLLAPDAPTHAAEYVDRVGEVRRGEYTSGDFLLWAKGYAYLRRVPAFQTYLRSNGILDYWRKHGYPPQCRPQGDGAVCE